MQDIFIGTVFKNSKVFYRVNLAPLETTQFPFGLPIGEDFEDEGKAKEYAEKIQKYIDSFRQAILDGNV